MSVMDKILGKSDSQILKETVRKEANKKAKLSMSIAEYYSLLGSCKNTFERTIEIERLNVLERREKRIGDASQKSRIHDAAVGLLAIGEAEIELQSTGQAGDFAAAQKKLSAVLGQMKKLDHDVAISKKDLKSQTGFAFEDTNETESFVERAELVDEQFVEYLIQGLSLDECLAKKFPGGQTDTAYNFSSGNSSADAEYIDDVLRKNAEKR